LTQHNRVLRDALVGAGGAEIDRQGDSIFAVFSSAGAAVAAAVDAQRTIARQAWPDDATVRVRMGLHTGEAERSADGYVGLSVHKAARIGDAGHGGQVLISATTAALVEQELSDGVDLR